MSLNLMAFGKWYAGTIFFTYLMTLLISTRLNGDSMSATSVTITYLTEVCGTTFSAQWPKPLIKHQMSKMLY